MLPATEEKSLLKVPARSSRESYGLESYAQLYLATGTIIRRKAFQAVLAAVVAISSLSLQGCGSETGGDPGYRAPAVASPVYSSLATYQNVSSASPKNYLRISESDYNFSTTPNFYYSTDNQAFWSIQANVAVSLTDIDARNVIRIDIPKTGTELPLLNRPFSIGAGGEFEKFPGTFSVLDGRQSSQKRVESGTITFSPGSVMSETVSGSFSVVLTDYDSPAQPAPKYSLKGVFSFTMGGYGPVT